MNVGIKMTLELLARSAWLSRVVPRVQLLARDVTDVETGRADKMRALVDELHRRFVLAPDPPTQERSVMDLFDINKLDEQMRREIDSVVNPRPSIDADDACVFVAAAAMSVGIPCRFVGVRYGSSWTCWLSFEVDSPPTASCTKPTPEPRWEMIDPLRQKKPDHEPDEQVLAGTWAETTP